MSLAHRSQDNSLAFHKKQKIEHDQQILDGATSIHPAVTLRQKAASWNCDVTSEDFALKVDSEDPLRHLRGRFAYPKSKDIPEVDGSLVGEEECVYFCGHSLGLMPKLTPECVGRELEKWAKMGVFGHFTGSMPWATCDENIQPSMARIVGAKPDEVALMNALTVNLHLLLISFYEPTPSRHKILLESKAFPSDHYAIASQIRVKGYDPDSCMVCLEPREGEVTLRPDDVIDYLEREGESFAVVLLPSVQYYTGQLFDMKTITEVAHKKGCIVGFDLAHAVGNVPIYLHDWGVDFACWCTYKYLCSGAGNMAGAFIHERHAQSNRFRLTGWWSHKMESRFNMTNELDLAEGIAGYRISNPSATSCAALEASMKVFDETSIEELRVKSLLLTGYLELLLKHYFPKPEQDMPMECDYDSPFVTIITPEDPAQRGCQLSAKFSVPVTEVFHSLQRRGIVIDHRKPNVLRLSVKPLYNSFHDVYRFIKTLGAALKEANINALSNHTKPDE